MNKVYDIDVWCNLCYNLSIMEQNIPSGEFQASLNKTREFLVNGETVTVEWLPSDFSAFGVLNQVGVVCPDDETLPIMVGAEASDDYAGWATLHETMCQRGDLVRLYPELADDEVATEKRHPGHCQLVEGIIKDLMEQLSDKEYSFEDYKAERKVMFQAVIDMHQSAELDEMMQTTLNWLESLDENS